MRRIFYSNPLMPSGNYMYRTVSFDSQQRCILYVCVSFNSLCNRDYAFKQH
jgi:hypothetical protein